MAKFKDNKILLEEIEAEQESIRKQHEASTQETVAGKMLEGISTDANLEGRIAFRISSQSLSEFKRICNVLAINPSALIRRYIEDFINKNRNILE